VQELRHEARVPGTSLRVTSTLLAMASRELLKLFVNSGRYAEAIDTAALAMGM
jgi:hypothetical protein